jgi:hypothetical protein
MSTINPGFGRLLAGCGGALLIGATGAGDFRVTSLFPALPGAARSSH